MPIYEYECGSCGFRFERRQRYDEEPVGLCPQCEGKARRVINSVSVIFRGNGFYATDNRHSRSGWYHNDVKAKEDARGKDIDTIHHEDVKKVDEGKGESSPSEG